MAMAKRISDTYGNGRRVTRTGSDENAVKRLIQIVKLIRIVKKERLDLTRLRCEYQPGQEEYVWLDKSISRLDNVIEEYAERAEELSETM